MGGLQYSYTALLNNNAGPLMHVVALGRGLNRDHAEEEIMSVTWIVASALLSSFCTLLVVGVWANFYFQPRLRDSLQRELDEQVEKAAQVLSDRVEDGVRRGLAEGVRNLPSKELLEGASRNLARSSAEMVGERLGNIFGRKDKP